MDITMEAIFDGKVFKPIEACGLSANTRVKLRVESVPVPKGKPYSSLQTALALKLEGPSDWSEKLDDYLYGNRGGNVR